MFIFAFKRGLDVAKIISDGNIQGTLQVSKLFLLWNHSVPFWIRLLLYSIEMFSQTI